MNKQTITWIVLTLVVIALAAFVSLDTFRGDSADRYIDEIGESRDTGSVELEGDIFINDKESQLFE